ncbi:phospholipase D-like domain-containing protein [Ectobacillus ponti]|uniref:Phospholipase D-like domain-containing protein n=1 Tax=Ectobacillus ponti TaxID=2961894 RepID=A0AA42BTM1_9BACI|nr:phospholipase D-like domain-containing protein [Ectobacillus ponti]
MDIIKKWLRRSFLFTILLSVLLTWMHYDVKLGKRAYTREHPLQTTPLYEGDFQLYTTGKDLYDALLQDVTEAKSRIYIHFFIIRNDEIGKCFLQLLQQKASEGVEVKLSADLLGGFKLTKDTIRSLENSGVSFTYSRRTRLPHFFYSLQRRNHRRLIAIDSHISYIGGFNIGDEYLGKNKKLGRWRDYHIRVTGNGTAEVEQQFLRDWQEDNGERVTMKKPPVSGGTAYQYVYSSGSGLEREMVKWVDSAKQSLTIATPYFVPPPYLLVALHRALKRGVQVRILVTKTTDAWFTQPPSYPLLEKLQRSGAAVYQYTNGFFHGKVILIDGRFADIGTTNWDQRSILLNDESNCLIYDRAFIKQVRDSLQQDFQQAERFTSGELPFWQRFMRDTPQWIQLYL